jgi:hypothetical protein
MQNMAKGQVQIWPALPLEAWADTCQTLQLWTQVVGKVRAALTPWLNHSWHVVLYVYDAVWSARGSGEVNLITHSPGMICGNKSAPDIQTSVVAFVLGPATQLLSFANTA